MSACSHEGTIWRVRVVGLSAAWQGAWECTRCGRTWDAEPPELLVGRPPGGRVARPAVM
jgi:hypothetical protein